MVCGLTVVKMVVCLGRRQPAWEEEGAVCDGGRVARSGGCGEELPWGREEAQGCSPLSGWAIDLGEEEGPTEARGQEADCSGYRRQADSLRPSGERQCGAVGISERIASAEDISRRMSLLETGSWAVGGPVWLTDSRETWDIGKKLG